VGGGGTDADHGSQAFLFPFQKNNLG